MSRSGSRHAAVALVAALALLLAILPHVDAVRPSAPPGVMGDPTLDLAPMQQPEVAAAAAASTTTAAAEAAADDADSSAAALRFRGRFNPFKAVANVVKGAANVVTSAAKAVGNAVKTVARHVGKAVTGAIKGVTNFVRKVVGGGSKQAPQQSQAPTAASPEQLFGHLAGLFPKKPPLRPRPPGVEGRALDPNFEKLDMPDKCPEKCNGRGRCLMDPARLITTGRVRSHPYRCVCHPLWTGVACETRVDQYLRWFESNGTTPFPQCCQVCPSQFANPTSYDDLPVYLNPYSVSNCDPSLSADSRPNPGGRAPCWRPLSAEKSVNEVSKTPAQQLDSARRAALLEFEEHPLSGDLADIDDEELVRFLASKGIDVPHRTRAALPRKSASFLETVVQHHARFIGKVVKAVKNFFGGGKPQVSASGSLRIGGGGLQLSGSLSISSRPKQSAPAAPKAQSPIRTVFNKISTGVKNVVGAVTRIIGTPNPRPTPQTPRLFNAGVDIGGEYLQNRLRAAQKRLEAAAAAAEAEQRRKNYLEGNVKKHAEQQEKALAARLSYPVPECCIHCDFDFWTEANSRPPRPRGGGRGLNYIRALERQRIMERVGSAAVLREMRRREEQREEEEERYHSTTKAQDAQLSFVEVEDRPISTLMSTPAGQRRRNLAMQQREETLRSSRERVEMRDDPAAEPNPALRECCIVCPVPSEDPRGIDMEAVSDARRKLDENNNRFGTFLRSGRQQRVRPCCNACPSQFWLRTVSQDTNPFWGPEKMPPERVVPRDDADSQNGAPVQNLPPPPAQAVAVNTP